MPSGTTPGLGSSDTLFRQDFMASSLTRAGFAFKL